MLLWYLAIEVFKCINEINPAHLNECSYVKNVHMRWETALFWWDRKLTWHRTVWNPSEVTARKHLPVSYKVRISLNELKKMIKSWDGPKCKCSVCALYTWPDLLLFTHYIVLHKRLYVCVYMWIYVCMYIYIYIYIYRISYFKTFLYDLCVLLIFLNHPTSRFYANLCWR